MRSNYIITSIFLASSLLFSTSVMAGSESGFYLGGSLGSATIKAKGQTPSGDDSDFNVITAHNRVGPA